MSIKYIRPWPVKMGYQIYISKKYFENWKKLQRIVNLFVFLIKISCQSKESSLFLNNPPLYSNSCLSRKKYLIPTLIGKLEEVPHFIKGDSNCECTSIKENKWKSGYAGGKCQVLNYFKWIFNHFLYAVQMCNTLHAWKTFL